MAQTSQTQPFGDFHSPTKCLTSNQSSQLMDLFQLIKAFLKDLISRKNYLLKIRFIQTGVHRITLSVRALGA
jgi:hypothetical protein